MADRTWTDAPAARLGAFGVILIAAFGGGAALGAAFGPTQSSPAPAHSDSGQHATTSATPPGTHVGGEAGTHDG